MATQESVITRLKADRRFPEALAFLLGEPVNANFTKARKCLRPEVHKNGDANPSMVLEPKAGRVECRACGLSLGLLALGVELRRAASEAEVARLLDAHFYGTNPSSSPVVTAPEPPPTPWPFLPEIAESIRWSLTEHGGRRCYRIPVTDARGDPCRVKFRGPRGEDGRVYVRSEATPEGRNDEGLIGETDRLCSADPGALVLLPEGETCILRAIQRARQEGIEVIVVAPSNGAGNIGETGAAFRGLRVIVAQDADGPGRKGAASIVAQLRGCGAAEVIDCNPATLGVHDVRECLERGGTLSHLLSVAQSQQPTPSPAATDPTTPEIGDGAAGAAADAVPADRPLAGDEFSDARNAERFVARYGAAIRYSTSYGWMVYRCGVWTRDEKDVHVRRLAQSFGKEVLREAATAASGDLARSIREARRLRSEAGLEAMITAARSVPGVLVHVDEFDVALHLLNCRNGVIDLESGALLPHDPALLLTRQSPIAFDPDARCPRFEEFLAQCLVHEDASPDEELVRFIRRAAGYSATARTDEQVLLFLLGSGCNGKSVLLSVLQHVLGGYAASADPASFLQSKHSDRIRSDIARLHNARLVATTEPEIGEVLAAALIKRMTGGDKLVARFHYQPEFEFSFCGKLWFAANHPPAVRDDGEGLWRRVIVVPFHRSFTVEERDPKLTATLKAEAPGILNWLLAGAREWRERGLDPPASVSAASAAYRESEDVVARFVSECCIVGSGRSATSADLYAAWREWTERSGVPCGSGRDFGRRIADRKKRWGLAPWRTAGARGWSGISVRRGGEMTSSDVGSQLSREEEF